MLCPKCANEKSSVIKTIRGLIVERWRKCTKCGYSWMTDEKPRADKGLVEYTQYLEELKGEKR